MTDLLHIEDLNNLTVATFVKLPNNRFFGGRTFDNSTALPSAHMLMYLGGLLDYIGSIAQDGMHTITSNTGRMPLTQDIAANELAVIIECKPSEIVDHFRLLVRVSE